MPPRRATIYFDSAVHRALRLRSAAGKQTISELVNEAVRDRLAEDAEDLQAFENRAHEPDIDFKTVVRSLKRHGKT